jgi:hypothetical protein
VKIDNEKKSGEKTNAKKSERTKATAKQKFNLKENKIVVPVITSAVRRVHTRRRAKKEE